MKSRLSLPIIFGFALTSCQTASAAPVSPTLFSTPEIIQYKTKLAEASPAGFPSPSASITPDPKQELLASLALQDLSLRLNIPRDGITVESIAPAVWPDSNLGCSNIDRVAVQGKVTGFRIQLEASGLEYVYHTDHTDQIILCPPEKPDEPGLR